MAGLEIFKAFGSVFLDGADKTGKDLDDIDKKGSSVGTSFGKVGKGIAVVGAAMAGAAIAGAAAIFKLATKTAETTDRIDKLSQRLGLSREGFQEWDFVLSQNGVSIDSLQAGMKTLSQKMGDVISGVGPGIDLFDQLGVSVTDSTGAVKDQETVFNETIAALQGMEDGIVKADLAQQLLGKSGQELLPLLNATAEGTAALKQEAQDLGMVLSDDAVNAGVSFTDTMDKLQRTMGGLVAGAMAKILPLIEDLANKFAEILPPLIDFIAPLIEKLAPVFFELISKLLPPLATLLLALLPIIGPLMTIFIALLDSALIPILELFTKLITAVLPYVVKAFDWIAVTVIPAVTKAFKSLGDIFSNVFGGIKKIAEGIIKLFKGDFQGAIASFADGFKQYFSGIAEFYKKVINGIIRGINAFIGAANSISVNIPDWVPLIGGKSFGFNFNTIPLLGDGGNIMGSGAAIVGDNGPEILNLPQGASVTPLGNQGPLIIINNPKYFNKKDMDDMMNPVIKILRQQGLNPA